MIVINGKGAVLGRLASYVAKQLLLGKTIALVNCIDIIMVGDKHMILSKYEEDMWRGVPAKGPFFQRVPARFVKKVIKRMLPQTRHGQLYLKQLRCYNGVPEALQKNELVTVDAAHKSIKVRFVTVGEICKILGGKWQ